MSRIINLYDEIPIVVLENEISVINDTLKQHDVKFEWIGAKLTDFMSDISAIKNNTQIGLRDNKFTQEVIQTLATKIDMMAEHIKLSK